jgi:ketosteroid isomerase-like protein
MGSVCKPVWSAPRVPSYNSSARKVNRRNFMARPKPPAPTLVSADDIELELYEAMRRGDIERLMHVWSDDDEICCIHPGSARLVGAAAIRASFEAMFANGTIDAEPHRVRRLESHSSAVHSVLERIRLMTPEGEQFAWVIATNVYLKSSQGWRLVAHHASPGTSAEAQDNAEAASTLH